MQKFYNRKEILFLALLFLASLASLFFFLNYRTLAFPEHNIKFAITREQAAVEAKDFAQKQGVNIASDKEATIFESDTTSQTYLEREVGEEQTAQLASNQVALWNFTTRFFQPEKKEEVTVSFLPNGRLVGYTHDIDETAPGAKQTKDQAQKVAETFLTGTLAQNMSDWKFISGESNDRPKRTDHTFIWEKNNFKAKDATYRIAVNVQGDQIGGYTEYPKIPEAWLRQYDTETSQNTFAETIAEVVMVLLFGLSMLIIFILQFRRNNLRLKFGLKIGVLAGLIAFLTSINSLPLEFFNYPTTTSWDAFIGGLLFGNIIDSLSQGVLVVLIFATGEALYRTVFPQKLALEAVFTKAFTTKAVNKAIFIGVFVGIIFFSYEVAYYFLGRSIGFWSPADINYDDIFSTYLPWVYPLFIGFSAATTEEGIFRLFGITFLKKYVKKTWIAVLITSVVWAFLHSNYPQSPWFVRGIELSIVGIVFGTLFVRYGIVSSLVAHYTFNAVQTAIFFTTSGNAYAVGSSTFVSLLPFIAALCVLVWALWKKGFTLEKVEFLNSHIANKTSGMVADIYEKAKEVFSYQPFGRKTLAILVALSVISVVSFLKFGDITSVKHTPLSVDRQEALQKAQTALAEKGVNVNSYKQVVTFESNEDSQEEEYILEKADFKTLSSIYPDKIPTNLWSIRFFKPLQKEEYQVDVLPNGQIYQIAHLLDEKAKGANLSQQQALKKAQTYLTQVKKYDISHYTVVENTADKKENRTDYYFVFEEKNKKIADATFRSAVIIKGDEVAGFTQYIKLPEAWVREQNQTTTLDFVVDAVMSIVAIIILSLGIGTFLTFTREKQIPYKVSFKLAAIAVLFSLIGILNNLPTFYKDYSTDIPFNTFLWQSILTSGVGIVVKFFFLSISAGVFFALWKYTFGGFYPDETKDRKHYIRDAVIVTYLTPFLLSGVLILLLYLSLSHKSLQSISNYDGLTGLDSYVPLLSTISSLPDILIGTSLIASIILLLKKYLKKWKFVVIFVLGVVLLTAIPQQKSLSDFFVWLGETLPLFVGMMLIVAFVLRKNILAYILLISVTTIIASGFAFFDETKTFYIINGVILVIIALLPLLVYAVYQLRKRPS